MAFEMARLQVTMADHMGWLELFSAMLLLFKDFKKYRELTDRRFETFAMKRRVDDQRQPVGSVYLRFTSGGHVMMAMQMVMAGVHDIPLGAVSYNKRTNVVRFRGWFFKLLADEIHEMFEGELNQPVVIEEEVTARE